MDSSKIWRLLKSSWSRPNRRPRNRLLSLVLCEYTTTLAGAEGDSQPGLDNRIKGQRGLRAARHWRYASVTARTRDPIRCMLDVTSVPDAEVPPSIV